MKPSPIVLISIFQLFTLWLYYYGPIDYMGKEKSPIVATFIIAYIILLNAGYHLGKTAFLQGNSGPENFLKFLKAASIITLILFPLTFHSRVGSIVLNQSLGDFYAQSALRRSTTDSSIEYVRMFFSVYLFGLLPILVVFWKKTPKWLRIISISAISTTIITSIFMGTNRDIFNLIILLSFLLLIKSTIWNDYRIKPAKIAMLMIIPLSISMNFFVSTQLTRSGSSAVSGINPRIGSFSEYSEADGTLPVLYSALTSYLTQGYRAFDLSLDLPFISTLGFGNSEFISRQVDRAFGTNFGDSSYPARLEQVGWDRHINWSTFYLWMASDIHYFGVCLLMFGFGFLFRVVENTMAAKKDPASIIIYSYLVIQMIYLSANNQVFQSGEGFIGFTLLIIPMLLKRRIIFISKGNL